MKFSCERCQTRYSIGDDKVKGKVLKIRCKTCGNIIVVREQMPTVQAEASGYAMAQVSSQAAQAAAGGAQPRAETGPSLSMSSPPQQAQAQQQQQQRSPPPPAATRPLEWYVAIKGKQHGPAGRDDIARLFREGKISDRTYLWHDQLPSWTRLKDLAEFAALLAEGPAPRRPPPPPPSEDGAEIVNFEAARAQRQGQQQQQQQQQQREQQQAPGPVLNDPFAAISGAPGVGGDNAPRESTRVFIMQAGLHNRGKKQRIYAGVAVLCTLGFILLCIVDYQTNFLGLTNAIAVSTGIKEAPPVDEGAAWDDGEIDPKLKCRLMPNPEECEKKETARIVAKRRMRIAAKSGNPMSDDDLKGAFGTGPGDSGGKVGARGAGIDENGMFVGANGPSAEEIKKALGGGKAGPSGPRARIETPSVAGTTIDAENATKVVRDGQAGIQVCVDDAMKNNEDIPGKLRVTLSVGLKGTVEKAVINDAVANASSIGSCITRAARKWKFAPPTEPADLEIPLVLK
ncbi:MAG: AgmX/PglI C-terminal domain-containing protein [Deltaproteobacteria bacterium]|nr:AgmX/PglI C-terminal domain-containing protein [Deltaproteobacteria bacterium]